MIFYIDDILNLPSVFPAGEFPVKNWDDRLLIAAIYLRGGLTQEGDAYLNKVIQEKNYLDSDAQILSIRLHSPTLTFLPALWPQCPDCSVCRAKHLCRKTAVDALQNQLMKKLCRTS